MRISNAGQAPASLTWLVHAHRCARRHQALVLLVKQRSAARVAVLPIAAATNERAIAAHSRWRTEPARDIVARVVTWAVDHALAASAGQLAEQPFERLVLAAAHVRVRIHPRELRTVAHPIRILEQCRALTVWHEGDLGARAAKVEIAKG